MYYGQRDTDKYIEQYFGSKYVGRCIEVGAYDGIKGSNTKLFEDRGWEVVCIEPNPYIFPKLIENRKGPCLEAACGDANEMRELEIFDFQSNIQSSLTSLATDPRLIEDYADAIKHRHKVTVMVNTLDLILRSLGWTTVDFISIDTEGTELSVLRGLDLTKIRPKLLVVEDNYDDNDITHYLSAQGYIKDQRYFVNNFYIESQVILCDSILKAEF